ncbi:MULTISPECIES: hypothetical protein [Oerskovia]|uniref:DUF4175 domain-containing protein n=1 Tax=Oerskovia rustica TaxID=2762237 RepID=A0ABR8RV32_9CELL|nr:hypothetical protein [Oerskovia rustica]MBD7951651.1 hypothetical protein [Oerskovia rustica]
MSSPSGPRPVGNVLWLALGAFVLAAVLIATGAPVLPFLLLVLAVMWGTVGLTRYLRARHGSPPGHVPPGRAQPR